MEMSASRPDHQPGADRHTVHRRDDRFGAVDDVVDEVARLPEHPGPRTAKSATISSMRSKSPPDEKVPPAPRMITARVSVVDVHGAPHLREVAMHGGVGRVEATLRLHGDHQDPFLGTLEERLGNEVARSVMRVPATAR